MLTHFFGVALSFPSVVYTTLLGVALVYWVFVMLGAVHLDADGAADGALDGAVKGAAEGAADALAGHGAHGAHGHGHDAGGDAGGPDGDGGALSGLIASLKLRSAPATVVLSVLTLFSWLASVLAMQAAHGLSPDLASSFLVRAAVFLVAPLVALPLTSLAVRPLARVFTHAKAITKQDLVGKVCTIRTGTVTDRFGEALLEDGGAGLVVRVRVETDEKLKRGDQAVIVGYDAERHEFTVAPMENLLDEREREHERERGREEAAEDDEDARTLSASKKSGP